MDVPLPTAPRTMTPRALSAVGLLVAAAALLVVGWVVVDDPPAVARGRALYAQHCAACHGARLEGQPNWQTVGPDGKVLAPPHDATGHTWQHTDAELLRLTKNSVKDVAPEGYVSDMPAFAGRLSDAQIRAILGYIKSRWPRDIRAYQAMISNPTASQASALGGDWRFPALCHEPSRAVAAVRQRAIQQDAAPSVR